MDLSHDYILSLKRNHTALKVLQADNAPLILSFLHTAFVKSGARLCKASELEEQLSEFLHAIHSGFEQELYPQSASQYLKDWSSEEASYLRKFYTETSDEPHFDITPEVEQALHWLLDLGDRSFVGTESRLSSVFRLLREIVHLSQTDAESRRQHLLNEKEILEKRLEAIDQGIDSSLSDREIRERLHLLQDTSRKLLADFRQVEQNFRTLDRSTREQCAINASAKGAVLEIVLNENDVIWDSDQGQSFSAFWEMLMSPTSLSELRGLLQTVEELEQKLLEQTTSFFKGLDHRLSNAAAQVYKSNGSLADQLRKYLSSKSYLDNKYISERIASIEEKAASLHETPKEQSFVFIAGLKVELQLPLERTLYTTQQEPVMCTSPEEIVTLDIDATALFDQPFIDHAALRAELLRIVRESGPLTLKDVVVRYPISKGVSEILAYMRLAIIEKLGVVKEDDFDLLPCYLGTGRLHIVRVPRIWFGEIEHAA